AKGSPRADSVAPGELEDFLGRGPAHSWSATLAGTPVARYPRSASTASALTMTRARLASVGRHRGSDRVVAELPLRPAGRDRRARASSKQHSGNETGSTPHSGAETAPR